MQTGGAQPGVREGIFAVEDTHTFNADQVNTPWVCRGPVAGVTLLARCESLPQCERVWVRRRTDRVEWPDLRSLLHRLESCRRQWQPRGLGILGSLRWIQSSEVSLCVATGKQARTPITLPAVPRLRKEAGSPVATVFDLLLSELSESFWSWDSKGRREKNSPVKKILLN